MNKYFLGKIKQTIGCYFVIKLFAIISVTAIHRFHLILIFSDLNVNDLVHCFYFTALKATMILFIFIISTKVFKAFHSCSFGAVFVLTFLEEFAFEKSWILIFCTKRCYFFFDAIFRNSTEKEDHCN